MIGKFVIKHNVAITVVLRYIIGGAVFAAVLSYAVLNSLAGERGLVTSSFYCFDIAHLDAGLRGPENTEVPLVSGVGKSGVAMMIYVNAETKKWSFVIVDPEMDHACLVATGEDFEQADTDLFPPKTGGV